MGSNKCQIWVLNNLSSIKIHLYTINYRQLLYVFSSIIHMVIFSSMYYLLIYLILSTFGLCSFETWMLPERFLKVREILFFLSALSFSIFIPGGNLFPKLKHNHYNMNHVLVNSILYNMFISVFDTKPLKQPVFSSSQKSFPLNRW